MKNRLIVILSALFILSCTQNTSKDEDNNQNLLSTENTEIAKDGVFIHITEGYKDAHRVLMPLKMATMMASDKDVIVYMDIHAVDLLVNGAEDLMMDGFESCQTYLKKLADMNVGVYACPTCLQVAGYEPSDLMDGIKTAQKDRFFDFTSGRILTLDY